VTIVADTGAIYALIDASDSWHARVVEWWRRNTDSVVLPALVLAEISYLLHTRIGPDAEEAFVIAIAEDQFTIEPLEPDDVARAAALMRKYADLALGFVDASVMATAERLAAGVILTTDRRHFAAVRPRHTRTLTLAP
jgi:predicted nucleic acid-binding protein